MKKIVPEPSHDHVNPCLEGETLLMPDLAGGTQVFTCCLDEIRRGQQLLPQIICDREGEGRQTRSRFGIAIWNMERNV